MTVKTKKIHNDIEALIQKADNILITSHMEPDGDSLGSQLALRRYLIGLEKEVDIFNQGQISQKYEFLPDIEHVIDIDTGGTKEASEKYDLAIVLECPDTERTGDVRPLIDRAKMIINIDHHPDNTGYGDIAYLDSGASAVGEILSTYFFDVGYKIDREAAIQLYTAILTDTGRFRFNSTTRKTMEIAGKLIEAGADPRYISDSVYYSFSESTLHLIGKVFSRVRLFGGGKICLVAMDQNTLSENNFNPADTEGMAEYTLFGKGVVIGGLLKEVGKRRTKVSLRSRDGINVSELAHKYGGGGHNNASGFHIDLPLMEAQEKLLVDLKEIINGSV